jgi:dephospho-CoA kinase
MITFGLTGNICMGKSTIEKTLVKHNIKVIDADMVARQVVEPGTYGWHTIYLVFGEEYIKADHTLDRAKLGELVFSDKKAMDQLNAIMGPLIQAEVANQIKKLQDEGQQLICYSGALIVESGNADRYRPLVMAYCTPEQQLERLMARGTGHGPLTKERAMAIIKSQMPAEEKAHLADYIINTWGTIQDSVLQTEIIIEILRESNL